MRPTARVPTRTIPRILFLSLVTCLGAGCTLGPNYARPDVDVPESYRFANPAAPTATLPALPDWWEGFGDPDLDALVTEGLAANHDLRIATARVDEFEARVQGTRAQGLPIVGYGGVAGRQDTGGSPRDNYSAVLSASWELDLWGRIRRENEAARANLLATEHARMGVALTLVSAIVTSYVTLLDFDQQLKVSQATLAGRKTNVDVFQLRRDGGVVSDFEMMQVLAEYETAAAAIPTLKRAIAQQENALSVLIGRNPGGIKRGRVLHDLQTPPVPAGVPSELIARRPDILQSEQQLVSANALIGAARAQYFPSLSLTGSGGSVSSEFSDLFSGPTRVWSWAGQLLGPIFAGGAIDSVNRQADARQVQALEAYKQTIQNAFRDVDDSLVAIQQNRDLVASLERRVTSLRRAVVLATERYDNGYDDYLVVVDTERSLFTAELALSSARGDTYRSLVSLYRAMGGDWVEQVAPLPDRTAPPQTGSTGSSPDAAARNPPH